VPRVLPVMPLRNIPRRPFYFFRPIFPVVFPPGVGFFGGPFFSVRPGWGFRPFWSRPCGLYLSWGLGCNGFPTYFVIYGGGERDLVQLYLNDGTVYNVTDYWLVDDQLHFTTVEAGGTSPVESTIDFNQLDLQQTVNVNVQRGFRFVLRDEPFEQYVRDHPDGVPSAEPPVPTAIRR
jgi:hypothetical protein